MEYEILDEQSEPIKESLSQQGIRHTKRTGARVLESIANTPGNLLGTAQSISQAGSKLFGSKFTQGPKIPQAEELISKLGINTDQSGIFQNPIAQIPEFKIKGEGLQAQTQGEKDWDEVIKDAAALLFSNKIPTKSMIGRALGKSALGNIAKWGAEKFTGSTLAGEGAKFGTMLLAGTSGGRKELSNIEKQSYDKGWASVPPQAKFDVKPEMKKFKEAKKSISLSDRPDKEFLENRLDAMIKLGDNPEIKKFHGIKKDWNKWLRDPKIDDETRNKLKTYIGEANSGIARYGAKNPEFFNNYKIGEEIHGAMQSQNRVSKFINNNSLLKNIAHNPLTNALIYGSVGKAAHSVSYPKIAAVGAGILTAREVSRAMQLISKSPIAKRHYSKLLKASLAGNINVAARHLKKLDESFDNLDKNNPDEYDIIED
jgi:hypothetical protein